MKNLDEREFLCPLPVVHVKKAIEESKKGDLIVVKVNDNVKLENIKRLCANRGCDFSINEHSKDDIDIIITVGEKSISGNYNYSSCDIPEEKGKIVVKISSLMMGSGDETLGKNLLKAFLFALSKQDKLPDIMLFYNSGAFVTQKNSESIETLRELQEHGVKIYTCGTCLDFYNIKDSLGVGEITNMYDIVSYIENAAKIIAPETK